MIQRFIDSVAMDLFLRCGARLFPFIAIYRDEDAPDEVTVIHFATNKYKLGEACRKLGEETLKM